MTVTKCWMKLAKLEEQKEEEKVAEDKKQHSWMH